MLTRRSWAVAGLGGRLLLSDPAPMLVTAFMPLLLAPFLIPAAAAQLKLAGYSGSNGSEQIVPGLAVLFAFLSTQLIGTLFFREHAWGTWDRLRASSATAADIVIGKVAPLFAVQLAQLGFLVAIGAVLFGFRVTGSVLALALVLVAFAATLVAYGVMLVAVFRSMDLALVVGNLGGMLMAGIGGAFTPVNSLPEWVQVIAPLSPAYWALEAMRRVTLDAGGVPQVAEPIGVLAIFTLGFGAVIALRFRVTGTKVGTT